MVVFLVHRAEEEDAARELAWRLRWHDCTPTAVWTSPHEHAVLTATTLIEILEWDGPVEPHAVLGPRRTDPAAVVAALATLAPDAVVVLVGHEPFTAEPTVALGLMLLGGVALVRTERSRRGSPKAAPDEAAKAGTDEVR